MLPEGIKYILIKIQDSIVTEQYFHALNYLNQLIEKSTPHAEYFKRRAYIHQMLDNIDPAIDDLTRAINLDPDRSDYYWSRGALLSFKLSKEKFINNNIKKELHNRIITDYKNAIERDPSDPVIWLDLIEFQIVIHNFNNAVSLYGSSKPYITLPIHRKIRAWLGCIALIFAEEKIFKQDIIPLMEQSVRLRKTDWRVAEINRFLSDIQLNEKFTRKLKAANLIHKRFLRDFVEVPW